MTTVPIRLYKLTQNIPQRDRLKQFELMVFEIVPRREHSLAFTLRMLYRLDVSGRCHDRIFDGWSQNAGGRLLKAD